MTCGQSHDVRYRPPGRAPLTDWGRFIVRRRKELDWSATQAFEAAREGLQLGGKSRTAYLPFEYDREPDEREAAVFRRVFGGEPQEQDRAPKTAEAPQSETLLLVAAINDLVVELRATRAEQGRWNDGVDRALADIGARMPATPTSDPAPRPLADAQR